MNGLRAFDDMYQTAFDEFFDPDPDPNVPLTEVRVIEVLGELIRNIETRKDLDRLTFMIERERMEEFVEAVTDTYNAWLEEIADRLGPPTTAAP